MKIGQTLLLFTLMLSFTATCYGVDRSQDCEGMNHPAYQDEYRACLRVNIAAAANAAGVDCAECLFEQEKADSNGLVQALSAVAQPLAYFAGQFAISSYQHKTQKAWAAAYASGNAECTNRFNSYLDYSTASGANPILASEAQSFANSCNGYGYGSYAGYGGLSSNGFGGYGNPLLSNGYSQGYMSGYNGGYGYMNGMSGSLYGTGMLSGSIGVSGYLGTTPTTSSSVYQTGVTSGFSF